VDRLQSEVAEMRREAEAAGEGLAASAGGRTVTDVDDDLEELEHKRATHERGKDQAVQRRSRLRRAPHHCFRIDCFL